MNNRVIRFCLALSCGLAMGVSLTAQAVTTTISVPTELSTQQGNNITNWCPLTVNADLSVVSGGLLWVPWGGKIYLPGQAGIDATLRTEGSGAIEFYYTTVGCNNRLCIGAQGGRGHVVCAAAAGSTTANMLNFVVVGPKAEADESGYIDYLCISGGSFRATHLITNATPARVRMVGGALYVAKDPNGSSVCRDLFNIGPNSKLVLESVDGATLNIGLNQGDKHPWVNLSVGEGQFETRGTGDLLLGYGGGANCHIYFMMGPDQATWGHSGATILNNNFTAVVGCDQALPHGSQTGPILFQSTNQAQPKYLDLNGHTSQVNGIGYVGDVWASAQCSWVTNSCETAEGVLQVGGVNTNMTMVYDLHFRGNVVLEKIGTADLEIRNGDYTHLRVSEGSVQFNNDGTIDTVEIASNATFTVGRSLTIHKIVNRGGTLAFSSTGAVTNKDCIYETSIVDTSAMPSAWTAYDVMDRGYKGDGLKPTALSIVKRNDDTFTYFETGATFGDVDVREGRLRFGGSEDTNHYAYWRLTIRETTGSFVRMTNGVPKTISAGLGRWWLSNTEVSGDASGPSLLKWGGNDDDGTAPKDLAGDRWASAKEVLVARGAGTYAAGAQWLQPSVLGRPFYNNSYEAYYSVVWANDLPRAADPTTWESVYFRFASPATKTAGGYFLSKAANIDGTAAVPCSWTVEASADGETWVKMDDRVETNAVANCRGWWRNHGNLYLFNRFADSWHFAPTGQVRVASGAILDLTEIPEENIDLKTVTVDLTAGGGTIEHFVPARDGVLRLTNAPAADLVAEGVLKRRVTVPLTITGTAALENLETWKVTLDGVEQTDFVPRLNSAGQLTVVKHASFCVIVR